MSAPTARDLARYRALASQVATEVVHNARTNLDLRCWIAPGTGVPLPGLEQFEPFPDFLGHFTFDADLQPDDRLASTDRDVTFHVLEVKQEGTYNVDTWAQMLVVVGPNGSFPLPGTETVTFKNGNGDPDDIVEGERVYISQVGNDLALQQGVILNWNYEIVFNAGLKFPSGKYPTTDDKIIRTAGGFTRSVTLNTRPVLLTTPLPLKRGTFLEAP